MRVLAVLTPQQELGKLSKAVLFLLWGSVTPAGECASALCVRPLWRRMEQ